MNTQTATVRRVPLQVLAWAIGLAVSALAIVAWGRDFGWQVWPVRSYVLFPLLGLWAFSLMWSHYMIETLAG
jgi:hypothetical protein